MSLPEKFKVILVQGPGKEPTLEEVPLPKPGKNQVLVKVEFTPINPSDTMTIEGVYPVSAKPPHPVGFEGSGTIAALGEDLKVPHQVGDKVYMSGFGTFGQYLVTASESCSKIQEGISLEEASCHLVNPGTVICFARLVKKEGHKAAIHTAGSSALGRMMIRYFKHKGIKLINIVRRDEYIEELKKEGADYVLNSQAPDFEEKLKEISHKEEATIAFEAICGDLTGKVLRNQPDNSTIYVYGALAGGDCSGISAPDFIFKGKTITGFWMAKLMGELMKTGEIVEIVKEAHSLLPTILRSEIQKVFKIEQFKEALSFYKQHSSKGKVLFKPNS